MLYLDVQKSHKKWVDHSYNVNRHDAFEIPKIYAQKKTLQK